MASPLNEMKAKQFSFAGGFMPQIAICVADRFLNGWITHCKAVCCLCISDKVTSLGIKNFDILKFLREGT